MQKGKRIIIVGHHDFGHIAATELVLLAGIHKTQIMHSLDPIKDQMMDDLRIFGQSFKHLGDAAIKTAESLEYLRQYEVQLEPDPDLPMPTSFQDPKGKKTGTISCGMTDERRRQLRAKRKKKKKR